MDKARKAQSSGAVAVIVTDNVAGSTSDDQPMFAMSGDGNDDVIIPVVFLFYREARLLIRYLSENPKLEVKFWII